MINLDTWAVISFVLFLIGIVLRMYVVVRARGWGGYFKRQAGVHGEYQTLVKRGEAEAWPLYTGYVLLACGILVGFGSIFLYNMTGGKP